MSCEQLHETGIKDITNFISGVVSGAKAGIKELKASEGSNKAWTSIAKATSNMTLVFPVLVSRNMPIETAQLIAKTCERDDVSMLQVLFSALSVAETSDNGIDYIMSVHKNLKLGDKIDLDDFIDTMNSLPMNEDAMISYREAYDMVKEDMSNINFTLPDSISETGLNQCKLVRQGSDFLLLEGPAEKAKDIERIHKDIIASTTSSKYGPVKFTQVRDDTQELYDTITSQDYDSRFDNNAFDVKAILDEEIEKAMTNMDNNAFKILKNLSPTNFARTAEINFSDYKEEYKEKNNGNFPTESIKNLDSAIRETLKKIKDAKSLEEFKANNTDDVGKIAVDMFNMFSAQYQFKNGDSTKAAYQAASLRLSGMIETEKQKHQSKQDSKQAEIDYRKCIKDLRDYNLAVSKYNLDVNKYELDVNKYKEELKQNKIRNAQQYEKDRREANSKMLIDTDVKKANELIPTLMNVTFRKVVEGAEVASSIVVGVKAKLIPLDASDIAERIVAKNKDNNYFIKFFRATTREISFVKDFIFSIDKAKSDAISFSKKGKSNSIWKVLENRAKLSKAKRIVGKANSAMAISTLIITAEEAEMLKKMHGVDMYNPSTVSSIMRSYNLMAFGIVDDSLETFRFMKDNGENIFETYAYSALEKELRDGVAAKALNVVAKTQR